MLLRATLLPSWLLAWPSQADPLFPLNSTGTFLHRVRAVLAALAIDVCRTTCWLVAHTLWITHRVKGLPLAQHARPVTDRPQATG